MDEKKSKPNPQWRFSKPQKYLTYDMANRAAEALHYKSDKVYKVKRRADGFSVVECDLSLKTPSGGKHAR